ncbi:serine hydrolase domain-containing protein [Capnocytophaga felis]|uniref:Serine hydrolase n=1 Tax=Capnocytophaga felis TaxID=2267611 RepID=A0A5M4B723_9FLAO|nr:serine hydrolase domain-containing protein [Capnocytophaga felis]GET45057.1 serine hydrolase [Capnocytophaga felis]GET47779.1 serine hydrolase [Capnocytophaga felis]
MNLKYILLFSTIFSFFQSLFGQNKPLTDVEVFRKNPSEVISFDDAQKSAEKIIHFLLQEKRIPGASVTITKQNHVIWQKGYGYADIEKKKTIDPQNTLFRIASVSKPLSAVALARLQEKKEFDWNTSLYEYVPDFPKKPFDFTIKQLAGHLVGIRSYKGNEIFSNKPMSIEEGIGMFKNDILEFAPGTKYLYSSFNWNLVSLAMERCLNKKFEDIVSDEVLLPLQMQNTFADKGKIIQNQAIPYSRTKKGFQPATKVHNYYKLAGGGFLSTSNDVAKLGNVAICHDFLSQEIENEMLTTLCTDDDRETGYSIGWQSSKDWNGRPYYGHIGNGVGGYAWFYVYPQEQVVISMLFNTSNPQIDIYLQRITDFILEGAEYLDFGY